MESVPDIHGKDVIRGLIENELEAVKIQIEVLEEKKAELEHRLQQEYGV